MRKHAAQRRGLASSSLVFALSQVLLVGGIAVAAVYALPHSVSPIPTLQNEPRSVTLHYNWPHVITDAQLEATLTKLRPQLRHERPKINHVDHALRCWGKEATFEDANCLSGDEMLAMLTDQNAFAIHWGDDAMPLLMSGEYGPGFRTQEGDSSASHVDHTLGTLAEIGIPLDYPIVLKDQATPLTVKQLLTAAMLDFRLNQKEYEWTTVAAASYATGPTQWTSQDGEIITFDILADRLMRQEWVDGVCYGNHRLYALAMLLQFDDQAQLFRQSDSRSKVVAHLSEATARLIQSQADQGYWDENWEDGSRPAKAMQNGNPTMSRILATGHALEWWAIAPAEVLPPREVIVRGAQWLVREIDQMEAESVVKNYTFLTHVGRALCLWRGKFPHQLTPLNHSPTGADG